LVFNKVAMRLQKIKSMNHMERVLTLGETRNIGLLNLAIDIMVQ